MPLQNTEQPKDDQVKLDTEKAQALSDYKELSQTTIKTADQLRRLLKGHRVFTGESRVFNDQLEKVNQGPVETEKYLAAHPYTGEEIIRGLILRQAAEKVLIDDLPDNTHAKRSGRPSLEDHDNTPTLIPKVV